MAIDVIGIILIVLFFIRGYMKGIIVAVFSLLAIILGIICALKLSEWLAQWMLEKGWITNGWGQVLSYLILFFGVVLLVRIVAKAIEGSARLAMLGMVNGLIGGVVYALMAAIVWSCMLWVGSQTGLIKPEMIAQSKTYSYISPLAPWVFDHVGDVLPFAKDVFKDLSGFFDKLGK